MAQIGSTSYAEPVAGGTLHVVGTVEPPPANPFSCLVILDVDAPGLVDDVKDHFAGADTRYTNMPELTKGSAAAASYSVALNATDDSNHTVDKIMAVAVPGKTSEWRALVVTFRVDPSSSEAAKDLPRLCAAGTLPPQMCAH